MPEMSHPFQPEIMYVVAEYPSLTETFIEREIQALRDCGLDIHVYAFNSRHPNQNEPDARNVPDNVSYTSGVFTAASLLTHAGFFVSRPMNYLGLFLRILFGKHGINLLEGARRLRLFHRVICLCQHAKKERISRVHAQFAHVSAEVARQAARVLHVPFSVGTHAWDIFSQKPDKTRDCLAGADFITCCTRKGVNRLKDILPPASHGQLLLVRHGLPAHILDRQTKGNGHLILAVGRLIPKKGYCDLIDACDLLRTGGMNIHCLIVGDGRLRNALEEMVKILNLDDCVRLTGEMSQPAIMALMEREAAVFCHPSIIDEKGDRDGLPNVILEAMCCGLPVITTPISAAGEAIHHSANGLLVPQKDPEALARALARLLTDQKLRDELGKQARQTVLEEFTAEACVRPLAERFLAG